MHGIISRVARVGVLAAALAGCDSKTVTADNASKAEIAAKVKQSGIVEENFITPGRWRMVMTITDMTIPGMPPEMAKKLKGNLGQSRNFEHCVTAQEAKKPSEDFFSGDKAAACRYDHFTMGGGKVSMVMQCAHETGRQTVRMDGRYAPDQYDMTMVSTTQGKPGSPIGGMSFNARLAAKRLGVCTGKEQS
ncbi:DUF3617 domain-containing protein [Sphingobium sufflavum]|uniref:DUF3617 domain-containing protein n=1 Tax=Sphingobium sufflavum TaxID=1129547 RepID=UPI001F1CBF50|nr:DUF3617 domain-containing protein [Sphingobium sufflavum]MCE7795918.1 DUF3617 domain-containing protein [Sphingobium sufflavum]